MKNWTVLLIAYIAVSLFAVLNSCQTAPIIQTVDVAAEKERVDKSAKVLDGYASGEKDHTVPGAREDFQRAGDDLRSCGAKLVKIQKEANYCVDNMRNIQAELDGKKSELSATKNENSELKSKARASWWADFADNWMIRITWFGIGIVVIVGIQIALWFMGIFEKIGIGRVV